MSEINNYIPINRKLFEHKFWQEKRVYSKFEAWMDILQTARFENSKMYIGNKIVLIQRGTFLTSYRFLSQKWGWSIKKIRGFLGLLEDDNMVKKGHSKGTGQTLIIVCNYDKYNIAKAGKGTLSNTQRAQQGHSKGTKYNKDNNNIINKLIISSSPGSDYPSIFFHLAKSYHDLFLKVKGKNKTLEDARTDKWVDIIRKLIEIDKCSVPQLVGIRVYLEASHLGLEHTDPFWVNTIFSVAALRKKNKDGEFYFDRIAAQARIFLKKNLEYKKKVKTECDKLQKDTEN